MQPDRPKTIYDKIWDAHQVSTETDAPAILYITFTDKVILASPALNTALRFAVLPHALLIGWLSVRIWRSATLPRPALSV